MRKHNFNAGPAALPLEVLQRAQEEFVDYAASGMSIMEMSHRSVEYEGVHNEAQALIRELLEIPQGYRVLFLQGGASLQFAMLPMNFLPSDQIACYIQTGNWSNKAIKEARLLGQVEVIAASDARPRRAPDLHELQLPTHSAYVHITSNETIEGLRINDYPYTGEVPLVCDMSSDILSRKVDVSQFALIYAGAQKNLGPAGVTVVLVREDMLERVNRELPSMLRYDVHVKGNSLYNTPPTFSIYMMNLVLQWMKSQGGLDVIEERNIRKAQLIYDVIDKSGGFYEGLVAMKDRSLMNVTFGIATEDLEQTFLSETKANGFIGLKGHREMGHFRASIYNAVTEESCRELANFMNDFAQRHQ